MRFPCDALQWLWIRGGAIRCRGLDLFRLGFDSEVSFEGFLWHGKTNNGYKSASVAHRSPPEPSTLGRTLTRTRPLVGYRLARARFTSILTVRNLMSLGLDRFVPVEDLLRPIHQGVGVRAPLLRWHLREPLLEGVLVI